MVGVEEELVAVSGGWELVEQGCGSKTARAASAAAPSSSRPGAAWPGAGTAGAAWASAPSSSRPGAVTAGSRVGRGVSRGAASAQDSPVAAAALAVRSRRHHHFFLSVGDERNREYIARLEETRS